MEGCLFTFLGIKCHILFLSSSCTTKLSFHTTQIGIPWNTIGHSFHQFCLVSSCGMQRRLVGFSQIDWFDWLLMEYYRQEENWAMHSNKNNVLTFTASTYLKSIEKSMGKMTLQSSVDPVESRSYPERVDEPDCAYYMRTGLCGYGPNCYLNHPPNLK